MKNSDAAIGDLDAAQTINKIISLVSSRQSGEALDLLRRLAESAPQIQNFHLLRALFLQNSSLSFGCFEAVREELALFPSNQAAANLLKELEANRRKLLEQTAALPKDILFSLVLVAESSLIANKRVIQAILHQVYPNLEILVVQREPDSGLKQALSVIDPRVRVLEAFGSTFWRAVEYGLQSSHGHYQMVIPNTSVVFADAGLHSLACVLHNAREFDFLVGQRSYLDSLGIALPMRCDYLQFSRASFLEEESLNPPNALLSFTSTLWSQRIFQKVGNRLATELHEAVDFELFARFFREAPLITVPLPLGLGAMSVEADREQYSLRYINEALQTIRREKRERPVSVEDTKVGPRLELFGSEGASHALQQKQLKPSPPLPAQCTRLLQSAGPTITLVMPSFNQARFLDQSIDSILSQGYPRLEFIIIDGGSTDGSVEIIKRYERHLSYWCSEKDEGQYFAVQKGFDRSKGEVMSWLNSDDKLCPQTLSWIGLIFLAFPNIRWVTGCGGTIHPSGMETRSDSASVFSRESYLMQGFDQPFIQQEGTFWRRSLWDEAGQALDVRYSLAADMELWRRFFRFAQLCSVDFSLGLFRIQPEQRSQVAQARYHREAESITRQELYLVQKGVFPEMLPALEPLTQALIIEAAEQLSLSSGVALA